MTDAVWSGFSLVTKAQIGLIGEAEDVLILLLLLHKRFELIGVLFFFCFCFRVSE